ncbi:MAG TPA: hypothetical protein PKZ16_02565 [bacterium]|nr:hypothetical protein [bacterium]HPL95758.1 hypothetical protein [bacterium]
MNFQAYHNTYAQKEINNRTHFLAEKKLPEGTIKQTGNFPDLDYWEDFKLRIILFFARLFKWPIKGLMINDNFIDTAVIYLGVNVWPATEFKLAERQKMDLSMPNEPKDLIVVLQTVLEKIHILVPEIVYFGADSNTQIKIWGKFRKIIK